jgi:hypothetical protein
MAAGCRGIIEIPPQSQLAIPAEDTVTINSNGSETISPPPVPMCTVTVRNVAIPMDCGRAGAVRR